ncbi:hypothetical protein WI26_28595 [Burkholderia diffusa]|nr:hypothetical protein WI26_28595 [Burkholderia diffusa]
MFTMVETVPALLVPVTEYAAMSVAEVGVPEITPVAGSRFRPAGNAGFTLYCVTAPPPLGELGSIDCPTWYTTEAWL